MTLPDSGRLQAQLRWYAAELPLAGAVVADVGAQVGAVSAFFHEAVGPAGRVVSIEAVAENVEAIRARIAARGATNWTVEACAASGRAGTVSLAMRRQPDGAWNSSVVARKAVRRVPARPLSALVPDAAVVKLDIEGHEYAVFDEALPRMAGVRAWAIELHQVTGRPLQLALGLLMAHGLRVFAAIERGEGWGSEEIGATLDWSAVPASRLRPDGSAFKMLHLIARRDAPER